ncbi:MAG: hypothetical protein AAF961_13140, partial [Planctomycetota bacterium]
GFTGNVLDDGVTLSFRARIASGGVLDEFHPAGENTTAPWPAGGDGGVINSNGKGMIGIRQASGGVVSFDLALPTDTDETGPNGGLVMNQGGGGVNNGDNGVANFVPLDDPTEFHEFYAIITGVDSEAGSHRLRLWVDGDVDNQLTFDVNAGGGSDGPFETYLAMGSPSTGASGAFDMDFVSVKAGAVLPFPAGPGDVNGDGVVDLEDFEPIRANFLGEVMDRADGDLSLDGVVDYDDFTEFKAEFLAAGGSLAELKFNAVPEPATGFSLAPIGLAIWMRRRRLAKGAF